MANGNPEAQSKDLGDKQSGRGIDIPSIKKSGAGRPALPRDEQGNIVRPPNKGPVILPAKKEQPKTVSKAAPTADTVESAKFIGYGVVSLVEMVESATHSKCEVKVAKKRPERLADFRKVLAEQALRPKEKEMISASVEKIALRHDWMTKFAPEVVLAITLAQYGARQVALLRFVENVTRDDKNSLTRAVTPESKTGQDADPGVAK